MTVWALFASVFLACAVEAVEATTIVLAAGTARDWRSALIGLASAVTVLAVAVVALGPAIGVLPIQSLRLFVGGFLLVFGLQWLRKAVLRAGGYKALHNEDEIFRKQLAAARAAATHRVGLVADWYAFTLSFKGVLLEGLESGVHRAHVRRQRRRYPHRGDRGRSSHRSGGVGRSTAPRPACAGPGKRVEVRGRRPC